jgi:hypothetical protein
MKKGQKRTTAPKTENEAQGNAPEEQKPLEFATDEVLAPEVLAPEVRPNEGEVKKEALLAQVTAIAKGREWRNVVHSFKRKNGTSGGTNLQFYYDCKLNEIENGQECDFVEPLAPPLEQAVQKPNGFPAMLASPKAMKTKKCPGCQ